MPNKLYSDQLMPYLDGLVPEREVEMQEMEARAQETDFPIIGPASGYLCYQVARMTKARRIFELGSGYGYSTAWFAKAVQENGGGVVHHVVWDEELSNDARGYLSRLGYDDIVQYHVAEAVETLSNTDGPFDLIFNDIDKAAYPSSLPVIDEKLKHGGVLIVDNMLHSGRVFDAEPDNPATPYIQELTRLLTESDDWVTTLVPIRDGVSVSFKK